MTADPPKLGTRIFLTGHIGTIKFLGSVHGTTGVWLGIEWDDPQRGKHDGAKDGVQYFTCAWVAFGLVVHLSHPFPPFQSPWFGVIHSADTLYRLRDNLHTSTSFEIRRGYPRAPGARICRPWFFQWGH